MNNNILKRLISQLDDVMADTVKSYDKEETMDMLRTTIADADEALETMRNTDVSDNMNEDLRNMYIQGAQHIMQRRNRANQIFNVIKQWPNEPVSDTHKLEAMREQLTKLDTDFTRTDERIEEVHAAISDGKRKTDLERAMAM